MTEPRPRVRALIIIATIVGAIVLVLALALPGAIALVTRAPVPSGQNGFVAVVPQPGLDAVYAWSETYLVQPTSDADVTYSLFIVMDGDLDPLDPAAVPLVVMQGPFADALTATSCEGTELRPSADSASIAVTHDVDWSGLSVPAQQAAKHYFTSAGVDVDGAPSVPSEEQLRSGTASAEDARYTTIRPVLADYTNSDRTLEMEDFDRNVLIDQATYEFDDAMWVELRCTFDGEALWHYEADIRELRHPALVVVDGGTDGASLANLWAKRELSVDEFPLVRFTDSNAVSSGTWRIRLDANSSSGPLVDSVRTSGLLAASVDGAGVQFLDQAQSSRREMEIAVAGVAAGLLGGLVFALTRTIGLFRRLPRE